MLCLCGENNRDNAKFCRDCGRSFKGVYLWLCAIVTFLTPGSLYGTATPNVNGNEAIVTPSPVPSQTAPASKN